MGGEGRNASVSRADLVRCFFSLNETQHPALAAWLGFEETPEVEEQPKSVPTPFDVEAAVQPDQEPDIKPPARVKAQGSSYYRITDRRIEGKQAAASKANLALPDWFTEAKPSYFQETETRVPARHRIRPEFPPLLPWSRLWPFLQRTLGAEVLGAKPDMNRLVKLVSQGKGIGRIPKRSRFTWSPAACLLIDINQHNFPYRHDFIRLQQQLSDWRGQEGLEVYFVYDEPGGYVQSYRDGHEVVAQWRPPAPDTPLLILSDLGSHGGSANSLNHWLCFGAQLAVQGIRATVLMPVAEREVDRRLLRYFNCVIWDGNSRLKPMQGDSAPVVNHAAAILADHLLALLLPAVRVDLGLLRSIRRLLPAHCYDVGHEAAIWRHAAVNHVGDEWAWQVGGKGDYQARFIEQFKQLPLTAQAKFIEQLGRHHAQFPDELYFEAMLELLLRGIPLSEELEQATLAFWSMLVKTVYDPQSTTEGLGLYAKRYVSRIRDSQVRGNSEHQIALIVAVEMLKHQQGDSAQIEWPVDIPPEKILPFINSQQSLQTYLLRQKGMELELINAQFAQENSDDFGSQAITLLRLSLADSHIFYRYHAEDGEDKQLSLNLATTQQIRLKLPPGTEQKLQVGTETIGIEVQSANASDSWIYRRGMGDDTVYIETKDGDSRVRKWYWHPPAMGQTNNPNNPEETKTWQTHPGFWYGQQPNQDLKPTWADSAGRDRFGLYADVAIAGVMQRFRWIAPGSFLMVESEGKEGRDESETRHQVNLSLGYWLADTACTQALWRAVMGKNPSHFEGGNRPVETISWTDIQKFLDRLNAKFPELALRLPTEAEWEYACRAGTEGDFNFDSALTLQQINYRGTWDDYVKWGEGALQQTAEVKSYPPNRWGLYEMHGNVCEWCQDWYGRYPSATVSDPKGPDTGEGRVLRGGSWINSGRLCRSAYRDRFTPDNAYHNIGFRLARGHEPGQSGADQQPAEPHAAAARGGQTGAGLREYYRLYSGLRRVDAPKVNPP